MTDVVERVARAIYEDRSGVGCLPWHNRPKTYRAAYLADARAALTSLLDPTPEMVEAGARAGCESTSGPFEFMSPAGQNAWRIEVTAAFKAMLTAALTKGGTNGR